MYNKFFEALSFIMVVMGMFAASFTKDYGVATYCVSVGIMFYLWAQKED